MDNLLTPQDWAEIAALRHEMHRLPEVSGQEAATAARVAAALRACAPAGPGGCAQAGDLDPARPQVLTGLGGHGVAAIFPGTGDGPTVMVRAELDALPIPEASAVAHRSQVPGVAHLCGHDGHSSILLALARALHREPPARGRVVLLFQPAEEDGSGAAAVLADPRFADMAPDYALALHNMPGLRFGHAALADGPAACASRGMRVALTGRTAHASTPETGVAPTGALARLLPALTALGRGGPLDDGYTLATVTHARLGERAFGITPGEAEVLVTLRTVGDAPMAALCTRAEALVRDIARSEGLSVAIGYEDVFPASSNDPVAAAILREALDAEGVPHGTAGQPMRASEDFGHFGHGARAAMFLLGAGEDHPALHDPRYDYPDPLTPIGTRVFLRAIRALLG